MIWNATWACFQERIPEEEKGEEAPEDSLWRVAEWRVMGEGLLHWKWSSEQKY